MYIYTSPNSSKKKMFINKTQIMSNKQNSVMCDIRVLPTTVPRTMYTGLLTVITS